MKNIRYFVIGALFWSFSAHANCFSQAKDAAENFVQKSHPEFKIKSSGPTCFFNDYGTPDPNCLGIGGMFGVAGSSQFGGYDSVYVVVSDGLPKDNSATTARLTVDYNQNTCEILHVSFSGDNGTW